MQNWPRSKACYSLWAHLQAPSRQISWGNVSQWLVVTWAYPCGERWLTSGWRQSSLWSGPRWIPLVGNRCESQLLAAEGWGGSGWSWNKIQQTYNSRGLHFDAWEQRNAYLLFTPCSFTFTLTNQLIQIWKNMSRNLVINTIGKMFLKWQIFWCLKESNIKTAEISYLRSSSSCSTCTTNFIPATTFRRLKKKGRPLSTDHVNVWHPNFVKITVPVEG